MPIFWRYLLGQYFKVLCLCVFAIIAILLTLRLDEIAHFASLSPGFLFILQFTLYQIPYILPIALPISCLISSILLLQKLSSSHELTALRASGFSLRNVLYPLLISSGFLSAFNFYTVSELATHSHFETSLLKTELRSLNPLLLLQNKHLLRMKGIFFDALGPSKIGHIATQALIAMPEKKTHRISLLLAKSLEATDTDFVGREVTLISPFRSLKESEPDQLLIESMGKSATALTDFTHIFQKKLGKLNNDHLPFGMLLIRLSEQKARFAQAIQANISLGEIKQIQREMNRSLSEIFRRFSVGASAFTFSLMGAAFGMSIGRIKTNRGVFVVIFLASLYLACYFIGKGIDHHLEASFLLNFLPHLLIIGLSFWSLSCVSRGIQ